MQKILRNLWIYVLFYECWAFFCELCDFSWIMRSDAIWGRLCEIAPSRNIRRPDKNFKYLGGWAGKSAMADATKTTARHIGHMTYTQASAVYEKNIFHLPYLFSYKPSDFYTNPH